MSSRPGLARLSLVALAVLASACQTQPSPSPAPATNAPAPASAAPEKAGADTLVIATQSDFESLVSVVEQGAHDGALIDNLFRPLVSSEFDCRLTWQPDLAESWEHPDDGLSITFHLAPGQKWSDGTPITVDDIAFTYDLVADPAVASPRFPYVERMKPDARPRILDPQTIRFEFTEAYDRTSQMAHCGLDIVPKHALQGYARASLRGTDFDKAPVTSGPWVLGKWEKGSSLELLPNPNYTGSKPATLSRVIFKIIPEYATRLIELENGSVDMIDNIQTPEDIGRLQKALPGLELHRRGWRFMDYVGWNLKNPLFADKSVRQALTMAINRQKLIDDLLTAPTGEKLGREAVSWITPALCDYQTEGVVTPFPFDPAKAKQMLAAAGWVDTNADGILDKDGKPFRFRLMTNTGNARRARAVVIIQSNLKDLGVDAQIEQIETNTFFERTRKKDFEAVLSGWSAGLFVDPTDLWHSDTPDKKYEFNFCSYANPKADELIERGMSTPRLEDQAPIWKELQQVIYEDQPYTFLYWRDEVVGIDGRFENVKCDMLAYIHDLSLWRVPESKVKYKY